MLYHTALRAPPSVLEIFTTRRRSTWGCSSVLGIRSVPCQVPTMSFGEAAGAAGVLCGADADEGACAPERTPPAIISPAIAMPDSHNRQFIAFWLQPVSRSTRFGVMEILPSAPIPEISQGTQNTGPSRHSKRIHGNGDGPEKGQNGPNRG